MRRLIAATLAITCLAAGCTSASAGKTTSASSTPVSTPAPTTAPVASGAEVPAGDVALIFAMYRKVSQAFRRNPDDGVREVIATQYPGDRADVGFARCINAIAPGAKTVPRSMSVSFAPKAKSTTPDPGYTVNSAHAHNLHPAGRIYTTEVTITQSGRASVHIRHQVVLNGKAYQFSAC